MLIKKPDIAYSKEEALRHIVRRVALHQVL